MKNFQRYYEFPTELAGDNIADLAKRIDGFKDLFFTVLVSERNGNQIYKIRSVNFNGLKETAKWCKDEESRDLYWFNNYDAVDAPSKANSTGRSSHYKRGLTSYIPVGALVDLVIEVHDTKTASNQTKDAFSRYEANLVRRVPETTPELRKAIEGKKFDTDALVEELQHRKRYNTLFLATMD